MTILDHCGKSMMHDHIASMGTGLSTEIVDDMQNPITWKQLSQTRTGWLGPYSVRSGAKL
jgi:hypothetical protein